MFYIGGLFAGLAVFSFLLFLRGFLTGIPELFTNNSNYAHLRIAYTRAVWATFLLVIMFATWEIVRAIAGWFGYVG